MEHERGIINVPIGRHRIHRKKFSIQKDGREAITQYCVVRKYQVLNIKGRRIWISLLELKPKTGRTHQIRVHLASLGHPIMGDFLYGSGKLNKEISKKLLINRQMLHASFLKIKIPEKGEKEFSLDFPDDMARVLSIVKEIL